MKAIKNPNKNIFKNYHGKYTIRIVRKDQWGDTREIRRVINGGIKEARKERDSMLIQMQATGFFKPMKPMTRYDTSRVVTKEQFLIAISGTKFKTLQQIGNELGISRERVRQLLHKYNMTKVPSRKKKVG